MVWPSGAKRAERMLPRRNVSCRYNGGGAGGAVNSSLPAYKPTASATRSPAAKTMRDGAILRAPTGEEPTPAAEVDPTEPAPDEDDSAVSATVEVRDESIERFNRFRSARISAAVWQRMSRSLSIALLIISSSLTGISGFSRVGTVGVRLRMASVMTAEVSPRKGKTPVAIS